MIGIRGVGASRFCPALNSFQPCLNHKRPTTKLGSLMLRACTTCLRVFTTQRRHGRMLFCDPNQSPSMVVCAHVGEP